MKKQDIIENMKAAGYLFVFFIGLMIVVSPLLLLMHDSGDGPDIYNYIGLACLALLIILGRKITWPKE